MVHDSAGCCEHNETELSGWQEVCGPLFHVSESNIESGGDHTTLVESACQVDNNLASTMIIDDLKLANVTMLHHYSEEADDNFGAGPEDRKSVVEGKRGDVGGRRNIKNKKINQQKQSFAY